MTSPTQRSLAKLRKEGYLCAIVEHYNAFIKCRMDLWGWCDILAIRPDEVLAVQTTSGVNITTRMKKILEHKNYSPVKASGIKIVVHGWEKKGLKWVCREKYL